MPNLLSSEHTETPTLPCVVIQEGLHNIQPVCTGHPLLFAYQILHSRADFNRRRILMMKKAQAATARRFTPRATLAALGIKLRSMKLLEPIQRNVEIPQKTVSTLHSKS